MYDNPWYPEPEVPPAHDIPYISPKQYLGAIAITFGFIVMMSVALVPETLLLFFCLMIITGRWKIIDMETEWPK